MDECMQWNDEAASRRMSRMVWGTLFFFSGMCALVYEVAYNRLLSVLLGADIVSSSIVLAVFVGGMFAGAVSVPRMLHWCKSRGLDGVRLYALLEMAIGVWPFVFVAFFSWGVGERGLYEWIGAGGAGFLVKLLLSAVFMFFPAFFMGATLPCAYDVLKRAYRVPQDAFVCLYYANVAGAALGALLPVFFLFPSFGIDGSLYAVSVVNLLIALSVVLFCSLDESVLEEGDEDVAASGGSGEKAPSAARDSVPVLDPIHAVVVSGAASFIAEVAVFRLFASLLTSATTSFAVMTSAFIAGLAFGSSWVKRSGRGRIEVTEVASVCLTCALFTVGLAFWAGAPVQSLLIWLSGFVGGSSSWYRMNLIILMVLFLSIAPLSFCWGAVSCMLSFFLPSGETECLSRYYAANTLGNLAGALVAGFVLLDLIGMGRTLLVSGLLMVYVAWRMRLPSRRRIFVYLVGAVCAAAMFLRGPYFSGVMDIYRSFRTRAAMFSTPWEVYSWLNRIRDTKYRLRYYSESKYGVVDVVELRGSRGGDGRLVFQVNGKVDGGNGGDCYTQGLVGMMGFLFGGSRLKNVCLLGIGTGHSLGEILRFPVDRVDLVELNRDCLEASRLFADLNGRWWLDERVHVKVCDGLSFIAAASDRWDEIVLEPSNPWFSGSANLFTEEFMRSCHEALKERGILVGWLQDYEADGLLLASFLNSVHEVFGDSVYVFRVPFARDLIYVALKGKRPSAGALKDGMAWVERYWTRAGQKGAAFYMPTKELVWLVLMSRVLGPDQWWIEGLGAAATYLDPYFEWEFIKEKWNKKKPLLFNENFVPCRLGGGDLAALLPGSALEAVLDYVHAIAERASALEGSERGRFMERVFMPEIWSVLCTMSPEAGTGRFPREAYVVRRSGYELSLLEEVFPAFSIKRKREILLRMSVELAGFAGFGRLVSTPSHGAGGEDVVSVRKRKLVEQLCRLAEKVPPTASMVDGMVGPWFGRFDFGTTERLLDALSAAAALDEGRAPGPGNGRKKRVQAALSAWRELVHWMRRGGWDARRLSPPARALLAKLIF